jgi:hypothetical protein
MAGQRTKEQLAGQQADPVSASQREPHDWSEQHDLGGGDEQPVR